MERTTVIIRDLQLVMSIGVFDPEKTAHQPVLVNIHADVETSRDWRADQYSQVVCYAKMVDGVRGLAAKGHVDLTETFAEMIAAFCLGMAGVKAVTVRVEKTAVLADTAAVGVEIRRERQ
jgi:dihydroneopterin aldolase